MLNVYLFICVCTYRQNQNKYTIYFTDFLLFKALSFTFHVTIKFFESMSL